MKYFKKAKLIRNIKKAMLELNKVEALKNIIDLHVLTGTSITDICEGLHFCDSKQALIYALEYQMKSNRLPYESYEKHLELVYEKGEMTDYEYVMKKADIDKEFGKITPVEYEVVALEADKKFIDRHGLNKDETDKKLNDLNIEILKIKLREGEITSAVYDKEVHTIRGKKWVNFSIHPDPDADDPTLIEVSVDYNRYYIEWLIDNGFDLNESDFAKIKKGSSEHHDLVVEMWVKQTLVRLSAGFLIDEHDGDTFRSVVASDPEGAFVENLEIDTSQIDEKSDDFGNMVKVIKNRRLYK